MDTWIKIGGQWTHIVITFDGEKKITYIDGDLWSIEQRGTSEYSKEFTSEDVQISYNKGVGKSSAT